MLRLLDAAKLAEYRALLTEVNTLAQEDLVKLWRSLEHLDRDALWESLRAGVPEIVELYRATAADTALLFYSETQGLAFDATEGLAASRVNREQVEASMRWALFAEGNNDPLALIAGIVQKHVIDGSRQYALNGFQKAGAGWYRAARPGACEFCRLLATRAVTDQGTPYTSAEAAITVGKGKSKPRGPQAHGGTFHDHCMCIPVRASEFQPPDHYEKWAKEYYGATSIVGTSDISQITWAMRNPEKAMELYNKK